ncbi:hypothetical protein [Micromonospora sp. WMMA1976]|uniref:hypothetical protein n=1 Tax=unclassified Micromonospora TaxID=2617518 RepID=UPI001890367C|nr:hypothetical protein [Micromonospora sp. WMMA1976]MBF5028903.1 hypothetical protein [Micromonospora sp. ANENR4]WBC00833.1 hypothetical protein O7546_16810 [Micromonospora sp. WMMA1976]
MDDLERELRELTGWLEPARTPDLTARVRARLDVPAPRRRWRYVLAAALATVLVAALPPGRAALADAVTGLLRFSGVVVDTAPALPPTGTPSPLPAQHEIALAEAQRQVRFPIRVPARLGAPEHVLVADPDGTGAHRVASLLYRGGTVRLDAFDGSLDIVFHKRSLGADVTLTHVGGEFAIWVGGPHALAYVDRSGTERVATARLSAATLIWERAGVSYRLEGDLTREQALDIASSLE